MKKTLSIIVCLLFGSLLFAESFTVTKVMGLVRYKENDAYVTVEEGMVLDGDCEINVGINAIVSLTDEKGRRIDIKSARSGNLFVLCNDALRTKQGLQKSRKVISASNIPEPKEGTSKGVATASTRASDAKDDFEWDE